MATFLSQSRRQLRIADPMKQGDHLSGAERLADELVYRRPTRLRSRIASTARVIAA